MNRVVSNVALLLATFGGVHCGLGFQAPLTSVQTFLVTNGYSVTVRYEVYDTALNTWMSATRQYAGNVSSFWVIAGLTVTDGIITWVASASGQFASHDTELGCAVYDPNRRSWRERTWRYEGNSLNYWTIPTLTVAGGVVAWRAEGGGTLPLWDNELGCAVYDPAQGAWQERRRLYEGTALSYWGVTNLIAADGLVAWQVNNLGQFSLGHKRVGYAVYDPLNAVWMDDSQYYEGRLNDVWTVSSLTIAGQTIQWNAAHPGETIREIRGYDQPHRLWAKAATTPVASYVSSAGFGTAPLGLWFTDMSIGATNWNWDFRDGMPSTERSPYHVFTNSGIYPVFLDITGPGGSSSASLTVSVDSGSGVLRFDPAQAQLVGGAMHLQLTGVSAVKPVILYASTNLLDWLPIYTNPPQPGPIELVDPLVTGRSQRFYRAAEVP